MSARLPYIVVDAPGCYGDAGRVLSCHRTAAAALAAARRAGPRYVARRGWHAKGERWLRVYEETSPLLGIAESLP